MNIIFDKKTIVQASDLKEKLENLDLEETKTTIVSLDIESMYPSIKFLMVKKAYQDIKKYASLVA